MRLRIFEMTLGALHDVGVQRLAAQVEEAVLQADIFRVIWLAKHRQRQFARLRQDLDIACKHLDCAGRQVGFTVSSERAFTSPSTRITHSPRTSRRS
jgi:hypothetical protein